MSLFVGLFQLRHDLAGKLLAPDDADLFNVRVDNVKCPKLLARLVVEEGIPPTVARGLVETRKVHPSVCGEHTLEFAMKLRHKQVRTDNTAEGHVRKLANSLAVAQSTKQHQNGVFVWGCNCKKLSKTLRTK